MQLGSRRVPRRLRAQTVILALSLVVSGGSFPIQARAAGAWAPLSQAAPDTIATMLLLSDGTVMAHGAGSRYWYRLTPNASGSYINGTWSALAPMQDSRLYYASAMLRDGRVFVAGGEFGSGGSSAEVYDPVSDVWTPVPATALVQKFSDSISDILPDGTVLVAPVYPSAFGGTVIYDPVTNDWRAGPTLFRGYCQSEASWVKLADESLLTIDPYGTNSERYVPALNAWIDDGTVPAQLYDTNGELGAGLLLSDGRALFLGGTGHTALYTPTGTTNAGSWTSGPDLPDAQGTSDAPAAMLVNGRILCATGPAQTFDPPVRFYEYDPGSNAFSQVNGPTGSPTYDAAAPYYTALLDLPDGTVLFSSFNTQLYVYQPAGAPLAAGRPAINSVSRNPDGSYHLTGTGLNGISAGAAYGDDAQMNSNYPLVRLTDASNHVYYARTYNWTSTGIMTGNTPVATEFTLPGNLPPGAYSLVVVANGISSLPVPFTAQYVLRLVQSGSHATLRWPKAPTGAKLETATSLSSGAWTPVTNGIVLDGNECVCTNAMTNGFRFYRLRGS
jgi:hypothetical protein